MEYSINLLKIRLKRTLRRNELIRKRNQRILRQLNSKSSDPSFEKAIISLLKHNKAIDRTRLFFNEVLRSV